MTLTTSSTHYGSYLALTSRGALGRFSSLLEAVRAISVVRGEHLNELHTEQDGTLWDVVDRDGVLVGMVLS